MTELISIPDAAHWFGIPFTDLDCRHWLPYLDAEVIGMEADRKLTVPLPKTTTTPPHIKPTAQSSADAR